MSKIFNFKFSIFNKNPRSGFTVLESIVAVMILSLAISGAFSAVQQGLSQSIIAKDEVKAFYLAQEAVELIRNKRDNNQLVFMNGGADSWLSGITDAPNCPPNKVCRADVVAHSLTLCGDNWESCPVLKQDQSTFLYSYTSGTNTNFKREIKIEPSTDPNEIKITVKIYWTKGIITRSFEFKTLLHDRI